MRRHANNDIIIFNDLILQTPVVANKRDVHEGYMSLQVNFMHICTYIVYCYTRQLATTSLWGEPEAALCLWTVQHELQLCSA